MRLSSPKSRIVQCCVSIFILNLNGAVCLQQGLHHLHVALVSRDLQSSLSLVLYVHLPGTQYVIEGSLEPTTVWKQTVPCADYLEII